MVGSGGRTSSQGWERELEYNRIEYKYSQPRSEERRVTRCPAATC
jgi:hypothetical protein